MSSPVTAGRAADIEPFWLDYQRACQVKVPGFSAAALALTSSLADELAELVATGVKRAHATLHRDFQKDLEALPQIGDHLVVLDGAGQPRVIVRTTLSASTAATMYTRSPTVLTVSAVINPSIVSESCRAVNRPITLLTIQRPHHHGSSACLPAPPAVGVWTATSRTI